MSSSRRIRYLFVFFLIYLPVQYGLVGWISLHESEPWPAFLFPGFKSVYQFDPETFVVSSVEFHAHDDEGFLVMSDLELFDALPLSQSQGFLRANFQDEEKIHNFDPSTRQWFHQRLKEKHPDRSFSDLDVVWVDTRYNRRESTATDSLWKKRVRIPLTVGTNVAEDSRRSR